MERIIKTIFCILFIAASLWGCADAPDVLTTTEAASSSEITPQPETTTQAKTTAQTETRTQWVFDEGPNWKYVIGGNDYFAVYDNEGRELYREENHREPKFTEISKNLLKVDVSGGNMQMLTHFFDVEQGICSPKYMNVLEFGYDKVVYMCWRNQDELDLGLELVVHDMFEPQRNRRVFQRDFAFGMTLPIEVKQNTYTWESVQEVRFIDNNTLFVKYYNNQGKLVEETLKLK